MRDLTYDAEYQDDFVWAALTQGWPWVGAVSEADRALWRLIGPAPESEAQGDDAHATGDDRLCR